GDEWMIPLLEFRDWLAEIRNDARYRWPKRRGRKEGLGPFTLKARREIYERLIQAEEIVRAHPKGRGLRLIGASEKRLIEELWREDRYKGVSLIKLEAIARRSAKVKISSKSRTTRKVAPHQPTYPIRGSVDLSMVAP